MATKFWIYHSYVSPRQWSKRLQTPNQACGKNDTAWQFTKILANVPLSTRELRNRPLKKSDFVIFILSHTKLLTSTAYKLKQILSYFMHRTTLLSSQQPLSARLSANWQEWRFWVAVVPWSCNTTPFWATNKVKVQTCTYCACTVHMLTRSNTLSLKWWLHSSYWILVNATSGGSRPLRGIPTNLCLSVSTVTVPSWRRGFLSWRVEHVSSKH